jgi:hypothetical protein
MVDRCRMQISLVWCTRGPAVALAAPVTFGTSWVWRQKANRDTTENSHVLIPMLNLPNTIRINQLVQPPFKWTRLVGKRTELLLNGYLVE